MTPGGYPTDWEAIARGVKDRAGWCCEDCGAKHGDWGSRDRAGRFLRVDPAEMRKLGHGVPPFRRRLSRGGYVKVVVIIVQAAHLNQTPSDCRPENLRCLCRRCHLAYDLGQHVRNAGVTRRRKMGTIDLFGGGQEQVDGSRQLGG